MPTRRFFLRLAPAGVAALLVSSRSVTAADRRAFAPDAFAEAQAAGRPILIVVSASCCPTCRVQRAHVDAVLADPRMAGVILFEVDFDTQKDALRLLGARGRSTLIVMRGAEERGRAIGMTDGARIRDLMLRAL